jgi:hypothetical protein
VVDGERIKSMVEAGAGQRLVGSIPGVQGRLHRAQQKAIREQRSKSLVGAGYPVCERCGGQRVEAFAAGTQETCPVCGAPVA